MRTTTRKNASLLLLAASLVFGTSASATTIYNNTVNDSNLRFGPTTEFGDEIVFAGTARVLTNFSFEYWALNNGTVNPVGFSPTASARIRFYLNNGPTFNGYNTPGTVLFDSGNFLITPPGPTARSTFVFSAGVDFPLQGLNLAANGPISNMTWTVQFTGLDGDDTAGLDVFYPPVVGSSPAQQNNRLDDYWEFSAGSWALKTNIVNMSFAARFDAVPEPSTVIVGIFGGLGLLILGRRFLRNAV